MVEKKKRCLSGERAIIFVTFDTLQLKGRRAGNTSSAVWRAERCETFIKDNMQV